MSGLSKSALALLAAAEAYGDAKVSQDRAIMAWKPGDNIAFPVSTLDNLKSSARTYATSTRRKRTQTAQPDHHGGG